MSGHGSLSGEEVAQLRDAFSLFDKNGTGQITKDDMGEVMRSLGLSPTESELQDMINEVDIDKSGAIDFSEFLKMMTIKTSESDQMTELREVFKVFDHDQSGTISISELRSVMKSLGENLSDAEIDDMMKAADKDASGTIDFDEFVELMIGDAKR